MNESTHIIEEVRALRIAQLDLTKQMSDVCGDIRTLVSEMRHTQQGHESMTIRMKEAENQMRIIQLENAGNKMILDIAKGMYRNQWVTILFAIGAVIGSNWKKFL